MKQPILFVLLISINLSSIAREGMWLPNKINANIAEMQEMGLNLDAHHLYNDSASGINQAVVRFGSGCTGSIISPAGLIITNYHCAHRTIQSLSTLTNNILMDGYWSKSFHDDIPCPKLKVSIVTAMYDISNQLQKGVADTIVPHQKQIIQKANVDSIRETLNLKKGERTLIKTLDGKQTTYLYIIKEFRDVRLVAAPPHSIGKFGGDTDNWVWPRHTADFSLFRIYADSLNQPANYSKNNIPYEPNKFIPISSKGISKGDFTMVYGFPGTTTENIHSSLIEHDLENSYPQRINIRKIKLDLIKKYMEENDSVKMLYSSKAASISNSWKKWQGILFGMKETKGLEHKKIVEKNILDVYNTDTLQQQNIVNLYQTISNEVNYWQDNHKAHNYYIETFYYHPGIYQLCNDLYALINQETSITPNQLSNNLKKVDLYFNNFNYALEKDLFIALSRNYLNNLDDEFIPKELQRIKGQNNETKALQTLFEKSIFTKKSKLIELLNDTTKSTYRKLAKDPIFELTQQVKSIYTNKISPKYYQHKAKIDSMNIAFLKLKQKSGYGTGYPDANSTLRISYGKVDGYAPKDAIRYHHQTTHKGIIEKYKLGISDYDAPSKFISLLYDENFGRWGNKENELTTCFVATNHTSGGNSGSPVLNSSGKLIGVNFDRTWESTMSDLYFDENLCRNITLDIRYVLFIIEKFGEAHNIINELYITE